MVFDKKVVCRKVIWGHGACGGGESMGYCDELGECNMVVVLYKERAYGCKPEAVSCKHEEVWYKPEVVS